MKPAINSRLSHYDDTVGSTDQVNAQSPCCFEIVNKNFEVRHRYGLNVLKLFTNFHSHLKTA